MGPTTHVLSQSQVTNILWHPCGAGGNCLVTVTADAIIRLWEFNIEDRFSSANPALAIDLRKLVVGSSEEESFGPEDFRKSRGFSSDDVGLEVASACFGGSGSSHESGWSAMTLWIAMKGGDVYALCPLLPSKWQPSATLIPSLSSAAVAKNALIEEQGESPDLENKRQCRDQLGWIRDVDGQDPTFLYPDDEFSPEIYNRPSHPGPIPRLQGPFQIFPDDIDEYLELSDIHVVASKIDSAEFMNDDDSDSEAESVDDSGVSASVIVLMTRNGRVYVCLDLEGIEGQWLPRKKPKHSFSPPPEPYLVVLEGLDTLSRTEQLDLQWPTFSPDINSRYSLFATHNHGVFYFSFDPWIQSLEKELQSNEKFGAPLRIDLIRNGPGTLTERILHFDEEESSDSERAVSACLTFDDSDLGYFLLTSINRHPEAVTFDDQYQSYGRPQLKYEAEEDQMPDMSLLNIGPVRTIYQPSDSFYAESSLPRFLEKNVPSRHKRMIKEEIRLSTATLDLMTQAHRILSEETHRLGLAASDLFRRCERLRDELSDQVSRANEVAQRTENLSGEDADIYLETIKRKQPPSLEQRLENVRSKQEELTGRYDRLRKKFSNAGGRALSEKERLWVEEVDQAHTSTASPPPEAEDDEQLASELWHRCREVRYPGQYGVFSSPIH